MIIVNGWKPLTIITKRPILNVAAILDPRLRGQLCLIDLYLCALTIMQWYFISIRPGD